MSEHPDAQLARISALAAACNAVDGILTARLLDDVIGDRPLDDDEYQALCAVYREFDGKLDDAVALAVSHGLYDKVGKDTWDGDDDA